MSNSVDKGAPKKFLLEIDQSREFDPLSDLGNSIVKTPGDVNLVDETCHCPAILV